MLSENLLLLQEDICLGSTLNNTDVRGAYSPMQFVLRLRNDVRDALKSDFYPEKIQALSTSIHENIHWWQHVGSNFGFLYSLCYPAFAHMSKHLLSKLVDQDLAYKSILKFDKTYYEKYGVADIFDINLIVNNYYDLEYAKLFAIDNKNIKYIYDDKRYFLNIGHCYHIFWSSNISVVADTIDPQYSFLPKINDWVKEFVRLTDEKIDGFYVESPVHMSLTGVKAIYEGQAIFNQVQYLAKALNEKLMYVECENIGMLHGVYVEAFEIYLKTTNIARPVFVLDIKISLFLLVCDLSINPSNGFPLEIYDYEDFIIKNDPGMRFMQLCHTIAEKPDFFLDKIKLHSKEEYIELSKELSESIGCICPYESIAVVLKWGENESVMQVLREEEKFNYLNENLSIRLMFSKYYRFQEDKQKYPNVFCWFGYHGASNNDEVFGIVDYIRKKHHALFIDDYDGEIKPVVFDGQEEEDIWDTFNDFYMYNVLYDIILKWVSQEGDFKFDYTWLASSRADNIVNIVKKDFEKNFNISMDDVKIV
ncbi:hypothetical protein [Hymenobacter perfusus]|uniref:Uncharacterized protein n=1 Tax=Hymenobacter perfusus TaxID=1236770 RepID=A0A428KA82_9BACT|nr:hypothetical protein [Hymenobacter perfusus]RSK43295.1 hypothetical protein EI293_10310 [Hymenobacter perfusus]